MTSPRLFGLLAAVVLTHQVAYADCPRWNAGLSHCTTSPGSCDAGAEYTFGQERYYYSKNLTSTAQEACENAVYYSSVKGTPVTAVVNLRAGWAGCLLQGTSTYFTLVTFEEVTREAMCELTPNGPYKNLGMTGVDGTKFSHTQRVNISNQNLSSLGGGGSNSLRSDAGVARPPKIVGETFDELDLVESIIEYQNDDMYPLIYAPSAANVDHIIPRKDKFGCECGPNSYANALLVSWKLNIKMSNNSQDVDRQAILARWTLP